jgi:hypothetical protein
MQTIANANNHPMYVNNHPMGENSPNPVTLKPTDVLFEFKIQETISEPARDRRGVKVLWRNFWLFYYSRDRPLT